MPQVRCTPQSLWGLKFSLQGMGHHGELAFRMLQERGSMRVNGVSFEIEKEGWMSGRWTAHGSKGQLLRAHKASAFLRRFSIRTGDRSLNLQATSAFKMSYELDEKGKTIATFEKLSLFSRGIVINALGREQDFEALCFAAWLVLLMRRRHRKRRRS